MKARQYTEEQIIAVLREGEAGAKAKGRRQGIRSTTKEPPAPYCT